MTDRPDLMEEARALRQSINWGSNASVEVVAEVLDRLVAAAEQRTAERLAAQFESESQTLWTGEAIAAAIRRGTP